MTRGAVRRARVAAGVAALAAGLTALAACAPPGSEPAGAGRSTGADQPGPDQPEPDQEYRVTATVLESAGHGPMLCRNVADSYPPQCGGPEIVGWEWDRVEAESASGTTWGQYTLTGTWDGERFTVTGPPRPPGDAAGRSPATDFHTPCPEPDGGWRPVDPATATPEAQHEALARARSADGFAGAWVDQSYLEELGGDLTDLERERAANDPARLVLNLRFTGNLAERERWIREVWGGALCVTGAERSQQELRGIQERLHRDYPDIPGSGIDVRANAVTARVMVAGAGLQQEMDERYGEGAVVLNGWLQPVG